MKITVKKDYTTLSQLSKVKEDIKEFKSRYTDGDLKRAFCDATGNYDAWCADIIAVNIEAFPGGSFFNDETQFSVEIICRGFKKYIECRFYCDINLTIDTRDLIDYRGISTGQKLYSVDVYTIANT